MSEKIKISKKAADLIKKDFAAKKLLKNPPEFKKDNLQSIKRWIVDLSKLMIQK